jgi:hypothetical protein
MNSFLEALQRKRHETMMMMSTPVETGLAPRRPTEHNMTNGVFFFLILLISHTFSTTTTRRRSACRWRCEATQTHQIGRHADRAHRQRDRSQAAGQAMPAARHAESNSNTMTRTVASPGGQPKTR